MRITQRWLVLCYNPVYSLTIDSTRIKHCIGQRTNLYRPTGPRASFSTARFYSVAIWIVFTASSTVEVIPNDPNVSWPNVYRRLWTKNVFLNQKTNAVFKSRYFFLTSLDTIAFIWETIRWKHPIVPYQLSTEISLITGHIFARYL